IDLAVECWNAFGVDCRVAQIAALSAQQRNDAVDRPLHVLWRTHFPSTGKASQKMRTGCVFATVVNLHAGDPARTPDDAAGTDRGLEYRKITTHCTLR